MSLKDRLMFLLGLQHLEEYSMIKEKCTSSRFIVTAFLLILKIKNLGTFLKFVLEEK